MVCVLCLDWSLISLTALKKCHKNTETTANKGNGYKSFSESLSPADKTVLSKELLQSLGFDPLSKTIKTILERSLRESKQQHIEASERTQIFIDDEFKYNPELCPGTPTFPFLFQSTSTNEWVSLPTISEEEIESNIDLSQVKIMNLVTEESKACNTARNHLNALLPKSNQHIFLYHGTDHESARQNFTSGNIFACWATETRF